MHVVYNDDMTIGLLGLDKKNNLVALTYAKDNKFSEYHYYFGCEDDFDKLFSFSVPLSEDFAKIKKAVKKRLVYREVLIDNFDKFKKYLIKDMKKTHKRYKDD